MRRNSLIGLFISFGMLLLLLSCEEEKVITEVETPFAIREVHIPGVISSLSHLPVLISARVTHPEGNAGIERVEVLLPDSSGQGIDTLLLFDDGGAVNPKSGDLIAFDQVYSALVVPDTAWDSLEITFQAKVRAIAKSGQVLESPAQPVEIFPNQAPVLLNYFFPDSIPAGMAPVETKFTVNDPDGLEDIQWLLIEAKPQGSSTVVSTDTVFNPLNNSPVFTFPVDSAYAVAKQGNYDIGFVLEDRFGAKSVPVVHPLQVENTPPWLWGEDVPDTLTIPTGSDSTILEITIHVNDAQSLADIDSAYFNSILPNGNPSSANPILLFDDGNQGDLLAGDGIFSRKIKLLAGTSPGEYAFHFFATDKVGQRTTGPVHSILLVQ
ncbi:MAG TPA: hypothetical protein ENK14_06345 [Caldithrix sp.]|nr:hypothetical protein [Caldithrix sp.]